MADPLTTITDFIIKPSAPFAAGLVLFGAVWGFFKGVESVLTDDTKLEIAIWLVGVKLGQTLEPWPDTFAKVFDRVFGNKHLSWKCFLRSFAASSLMTLVGSLWYLTSLFHTYSHKMIVDGIEMDWSFRWWINELLVFLPPAVIANALPDYLSLLKTRYLIGAGYESLSARLMWTLIDTLCTGVLSLSSGLLIAILKPLSELYFTAVRPLASLVMRSHMTTPLFLPEFSLHEPVLDTVILLSPIWRSVFFYPAFFTSIWLWLYAGSGFLLKFAKRFDLGFQWFNSKFDIEKKPLQSIGLVAGALVALIYWAAVIVSRVM